MLQVRTSHFIVRPKQPLHWLAAVGLCALGVIAANQIYNWGAWVFALAYLALGIGFLSDRIVFDGSKLRRRGIGAWFLSLLGQCCEIELDEIEAVSSYAVKTGGGGIRYCTVISSEYVNWRITSAVPHYQGFIKAFFKAVNPHVLDSLSTELLLYWRESDPAFKSVNSTSVNAYNLERWRRKAIRLSFEGYYEAAASYFKIAHENAPDDPQVAYDMGRFWRRRAIAAGALSKQGANDLVRAETYFRMAGRLAREKKNARLLEKVGEAFYELQQFEPARQYFELATAIDPMRPRANLGLAGIALHNAQGVRAVYAYNQAVRGSETAGAEGLIQLALRKAEYCERLMRDDAFLLSEASWEAVLSQLKWARRGALGLFLLTWFLQLAIFELTTAIRDISREISATALIIWFCSLVASHVILALRRG